MLKSMYDFNWVVYKYFFLRPDVLPVFNGEVAIFFDERGNRDSAILFFFIVKFTGTPLF